MASTSRLRAAMEQAGSAYKIPKSNECMFIVNFRLLNPSTQPLRPSPQAPRRPHPLSFSWAARARVWVRGRVCMARARTVHNGFRTGSYLPNTLKKGHLCAPGAGQYCSIRSMLEFFTLSFL
jgi:hypothetical protein